jgi:hypothetical protein
MGVYAVTPGEGFYTTTTPYFDKMKVNLGNNQVRTVLKNEPRNRFANSELDYDFSSVKRIGYEDIIPVPVLQAESNAFKDKLKISIASNSGNKTYYSFANNDGFKEYTQPFEIDKTATVFAYCSNNNEKKSNVISATFFKKPNDYSIAIKSNYSAQYHAGGPEGLLDGILGNENWRKGDWQGYQGQDFEAVVDLKKEQSISQISARFLQDTRAWILMPTKVEYYVSKDNVNFQLAATVNNALEAKDYDVKIIAFDGKLKPQNVGYIKVKAYNFGKLPEWHQGAGYDAYLFIDEITVK